MVFKLDDDRKTFSVFAYKDIAEREQIQWSYGRLTNEKLLLNYGFTLGSKNEISTRFRIKLSMPDDVFTLILTFFVFIGNT